MEFNEISKVKIKNVFLNVFEQPISVFKKKFSFCNQRIEDSEGKI